MICRVCKSHKCSWYYPKTDPSKLPVREIRKVITHNLRWIDATYLERHGTPGEQRWIKLLAPLMVELEKRYGNVL